MDFKFGIAAQIRGKLFRFSTSLEDVNRVEEIRTVKEIPTQKGKGNKRIKKKETYLLK